MQTINPSLTWSTAVGSLCGYQAPIMDLVRIPNETASYFCVCIPPQFRPQPTTKFPLLLNFKRALVDQEVLSPGPTTREHEESSPFPGNYLRQIPVRTSFSPPPLHFTRRSINLTLKKDATRKKKKQIKTHLIASWILASSFLGVGQSGPGWGEGWNKRKEKSHIGDDR